MPSLVPPHSFCLKEVEITLYTALKYLRLWFDRKLTFKEYTKRTAAKAEKIDSSLKRLKLKLGELTKKRKMLANVAMSVLYRVPI